MTPACPPARLPALLLLLLSGPLQAQQYAAPEQMLRTGKYELAIAAYKKLAEAEPPPAAALKGLAKSLMEVGRYEEAETAARRSPQLANTLGEILYLRGRWLEAEQAYKEAVARKTPDRLKAELNLAIMAWDRGQRAEAMRGFNRFVELYNASDRLTADELTIIGIACRYLGSENPQMAKDALKAFDEAIAADPGDPEPRILLGNLFLEKYNSTDAEETFQSILAVNQVNARAILGMARSKAFDGDPEAFAMGKMALGLNANLVEARVFVAGQQIGLENRVAAENEAEAALNVNPSSLEALSVLGAAYFLQHDTAGYESARGRVFALNPAYADFYNTVAELASNNRLYMEGVELAREAVKVDPKSWRGYTLLGIGLMRTRRVPEGRQNLETAFKGDPYNVWTKNTLDLLDRMEKFKETKTKRFVFVMDPKESDLLTPYLSELAEEAYDKLQARYGFGASTPVRLEIFPSHADFSVRTMGLTGLGALGVSFGSLLAMDSPSARETGHFNWASTFWHELTHAFTLGATDNRIPRWFSEGLSVLEERRARKGWGDDVTLQFLMADQEDKLLPIESLNDGFVRPAFPERIFFSYYQASLICEMIERDAGMKGILDMLTAYKDGKATVQVFRDVLHTELSAFDIKFDTYMKQRFGKSLASIRKGSLPPKGTDQTSLRDVVRRALADTTDFLRQMTAGEALVHEHKMEEAVPFLERAERLFPEYAAGDSPYWLLSQIFEFDGELPEAVAQLEKHNALNESDYRANIEEANLRVELKDSAGAATALERAIYISPMQPDVHVRLAALYTSIGERQKAVRERRAVLALDPVDRADALYQLASALFDAGDSAGARREVLRALEEAPSFGKAQELLLKIRGSR